MRKGNKVETAFNTYKLIKNIGNGGNGVVWSAEALDGQPVAIKILNNINTEKRKRFKNEINFCMKHQHKNLIEVLDYGLCKDKIADKEVNLMFYVMPLCFETLGDKIKKGIKPEDCVVIYESILSGLKYLHDNGCVHRDIKPENILFKENSNEAIISDLGIAHFMSEDLKTFIETKNTKRMANFQYAAPEQRQNGMNVDGRADVYSATLILNEMFTGEIAQAGDYKLIAEINPKYAYLDEVFKEIYKQNPEDRLYPETKILQEIKILADEQKDSQIADETKRRALEIAQPSTFELKLENVDFENELLYFQFDKNVPSEWLRIMTEYSFSHSEVLGYGPNVVHRDSPNSLFIKLRHYESNETIKNIVRHFKEWIKSVNNLYNQMLISEVEKERKRLEEERMRIIANSERRKSIKELLNGLY